MEIKEMQMADIEKRSLEIEQEMQNEDADIDSLSAEVEELEARKAEILAEVEQRKQEMADALKTAKEVESMEERKMSDMEIRNSKEYIDAYAEYVKSGNDAECRALLTENVNGGTVPVPELAADPESGKFSCLSAGCMDSAVRLPFFPDLWTCMETDILCQTAYLLQLPELFPWILPLQQ